MSVSLPAGSSSGRGRSLDAEINLVPFIDLLSMCICFLLITAVWIEIGALQVKQSHGTEGSAMTKADYELDLRFTGSTRASLALKRGGKAVRTVALTSANEAALLGDLEKNVGVLSREAGGKIAAAMITPATGVSYGHLVSAMDAFRKNQITNLGVVPVREGAR